jgi:hypothetical protein
MVILTEAKDLLFAGGYRYFAHSSRILLREILPVGTVCLRDAA